MTTEEFDTVINDQINICKDILITKAKEYATGDRLHNFKCAAGMMECSPEEALAGMMAKHTISVYDMCRSGKDYPIELWNEKITDHINYLLLLKAIIIDKKKEGAIKENLKDITVDSLIGFFNLDDGFKNRVNEMTDSEKRKVAKMMYANGIKDLDVCIPDPYNNVFTLISRIASLLDTPFETVVQWLEG